MAKEKTKKFCVKVYCQAMYWGEIEVPEKMTLEEAAEYAKDNISDISIPSSGLEYIPDSDEIEDEVVENDDCYFEDD